MFAEFGGVERVAQFFEKHIFTRFLDLIERGNVFAADLKFGVADEILEHPEFTAADEGERATRLARAASATDAVRIIFGVVRQIVVEDDFEVIDIEPARGDVGRHEELEAALAKFIHDAVALHLRDVAVQAVDRVTARREDLGEFVAHDLGAAENDAVAEIMHVDQTRKRFDLRAAVDFKVNLIDLRGVLSGGLDLDPSRIARVALN